MAQFRMKAALIDELLFRGNVFLPEELEWVAELKRFREDRSKSRMLGAVEAHLWNGKDADHPHWVLAKIAEGQLTFEIDAHGIVTMLVSSQTQAIRAHAGDYLILGLSGQLHVCPANVFLGRYEPA